MEIAVGGRMVDSVTGELSDVFETEELVTREQVFQALTINGAWQFGLEMERGSIMVGKWADFVLTDQDVFQCPVTDIHKTKVVSTWVEGEKVYQAMK
ncbi:MAG: amidohydrolase family protein [Lentisphaeria bacterium]|nr:amidohydrolase family protein [Lentisphaeria bacterium]